MKPICIIAARSGSKRIKNKNIINVLGKPMISYPITNALNSGLFRKIYVTTDSKKIRKVSEKYGAIVPSLRKKNLSNDKVGLQEVIIDFIKSNKFHKENFIVFIYATAILVDAKMIKKAIAKFKKSRCEYLLGIQEFKSNPLRALRIKKNFISFAHQKNSKKNTQDLDKLYYDIGTFFIFKTKTILKLPRKLPKKTSYYIYKKFEVCDIDDKEDLKLAKILLKNKKNA